MKVFLKSINNFLKKIIHDFSSSFYRSFLKIISYIILLLVLGFVAQSCAKAKTINNNFRTINSTQLTILEDVYHRSNYRNYVIASDYYQSGYSSYTDYYLCLTNEDLDLSNELSISTSCEKLYLYNTTGSYNFELISDKTLNVNNSFYYVSDNNSDPIIYLLVSILLVLSIFLFCYLMKRFVFVRRMI